MSKPVMPDQFVIRFNGVERPYYLGPIGDSGEFDTFDRPSLAKKYATPADALLAASKASEGIREGLALCRVDYAGEAVKSVIGQVADLLVNPGNERAKI